MGRGGLAWERLSLRSAGARASRSPRRFQGCRRAPSSRCLSARRRRRHPGRFCSPGDKVAPGRPAGPRGWREGALAGEGSAPGGGGGVFRWLHRGSLISPGSPPPPALFPGRECLYRTKARLVVSSPPSQCLAADRRPWRPGPRGARIPPTGAGLWLDPLLSDWALEGENAAPPQLGVSTLVFPAWATGPRVFQPLKVHLWESSRAKAFRGSFVLQWYSFNILRALWGLTPISQARG